MQWLYGGDDLSGRNVSFKTVAPPAFTAQMGLHDGMACPPHGLCRKLKRAGEKGYADVPGLIDSFRCGNLHDGRDTVIRMELKRLTASGKAFWQIFR